MKNYSAILEMYLGNRGGYDSIKPTKLEMDKLDEITLLENEFINEFGANSKLKILYHNLDDKISQLNVLGIENAFCEGFRFGFLMAIDVFDK